MKYLISLPKLGNIQLAGNYKVSRDACLVAGLLDVLDGSGPRLLCLPVVQGGAVDPQSLISIINFP